MPNKPKEAVYSNIEIARRLQNELPKWTFEDDCIKRKYKTHGWKGSLMVVNAIGHLAEAAFHHPELVVAYASVEVQLMTHDVRGITAKDFALARKIEDVIMWQPGKEGLGLQGAPNDDPRFAYINYD